MRAALILGLLSLGLCAQDPRLFAPSLARLRANDPKADEDVKPGSPVERTALSPDLEKAPWARKVQASEWLLRAYIHKQRSRTPVAGAAFACASDPYLVRAWRLLQGAESQASRELVGSSTVVDRNPSRASGLPDQGRVNSNSGLGVAQRETYWMALEWIRLEVAWRLRDPAGMATALAPFRERKTLEAREALHAFMAAAHAGEWPLFLKLGEELEAAGQMERLRALAATDWTLADYPGLLKQMRAQVPGPGGKEAAELRVKSMGLRLKGFRTEDAALAEKLKSGGGWSESGPVAVPLLRVGAVAHWLKPGTVALPLVGTMDGQSLRLEGSADLPLASGTAWRKETYALKPAADAPGRWIGTLEVVQQALEGAVPAAQVFTLSFEVRIDLESPAKS